MEKRKSLLKQGMRYVLSGFITPLTVRSVERIADSFLLVELEGEKLKEAKWKPGDKIQLDTGEFTFRTYTPISLDAATGRLRILCFVRPGSPAGTWLASLKPGSACDAFGPRTSLDASALTGPLIVFGDETSIGLVKALESRGDATRAFLETSAPAAAAEALRALDVPRVELLEKTPDDSHLRAIAEKIREAGPANFVLTGSARSIQILRSALTSSGDVAAAALKTRVYWADGKAGLD